MEAVRTDVDGLVARRYDETLGAAVGRPLVLVELDEDDAGPVDWSPGALPAVVVGVRPPGWHGAPDDDEPWDVVVAADDERLAAIEEQVQRHPLAATGLAVLLRAGAWRDVEAGLAAESAVYSMLQAGPEFNAWRSSRPPAHPAADTEPPVLVERDDAALTVVLNRPGSHNAVNEGLRAGLANALTVAALDPTIERVTLRGRGPSYCSGGDLREFGRFPDVATAHASRLTRSPARLAHAIRDRLHVELHGACLGAGIEVPAFAAHVTAQAHTRIGLPEVAIGLIPGAGGTVSLPRRIGRPRTALLALTGASIDATTALDWGLVDAVTG